MTRDRQAAALDAAVAAANRNLEAIERQTKDMAPALAVIADVMRKLFGDVLKD